VDFSISAEGITDQVTLQNVLCGYFNRVDNLEQEIAFVQPHIDATDEDASNRFGSWTNLFSYLRDKRFREDVINTEFLIIQVDTDVCEEGGFNVSKMDSNNKELNVIELVEKVVNRLIAQIAQGDAYFYNSYKEKIIFAISVHSIECWIYKYYETMERKSGKNIIKNCEQKLKQIVKKNNKKLSTNKTSGDYESLTKPFRKKKFIDEVIKKDASFEIFISQLDNVKYPISHE